MLDIFESIINGFIRVLAKEFFLRIVNYIIENKEKILAAVLNKKARDYCELSVNHPNTPFTYNVKEFVAHS